MGIANRRTGLWAIGPGTGLAIVAVGAMLAILGPDLRGAEAEPAVAERAAPEKATMGEAKAVPVTTGPITPRKVQRSVQVVGTFCGYDEVTVMAEVAGRVAKVLHEVGDVVRPGDVLLEIDATDYELAVEETRRALEFEAARIGIGPPANPNFEAEEILAILRGGFDMNKLPTVVRAKEQEDNAKARLDRARPLRESRTITEEDYEQRATDYQVALSTRIQAVMDAQAALAAIKHRLVLLKIAERKLKYARVVVPTPTKREGMPEIVEYAVARRKVTEGEMVKDSQGSSTAAFELVMDKVLKLIAAVPERYVGQVRLKQDAEVRVEAYPGRVFRGKVTRVNPMVDRTSRTFEVEVRVDNAARDLKAGGFGKVDILTHQDPEAWTLPIESLVSFVGSTKVFVVRDGKAHAVLVTPGMQGQGWIEIVRSASPDLRVQDQVITSGLERLAEGVPVRQKEAGETAK
jgi:multidrug efflux pump subunit AcrA (membrane-fusion protein)